MYGILANLNIAAWWALAVPTARTACSASTTQASGLFASSARIASLASWATAAVPAARPSSRCPNARSSGTAGNTTTRNDFQRRAADSAASTAVCSSSPSSSNRGATTSTSGLASAIADVSSRHCRTIWLNGAVLNETGSPASCSATPTYGISGSIV